MSMGLRVWDSAGNLKLDSNRRITRIVFEGYLTLVPNITNTITIPDLQANSNWTAQCQAYTPSGNDHLTSIVISLNTNSVGILLKYFAGGSGSIPAKLIVYRG